MAAFLDKLTSPPAQTLQILQPTSYTITYTVSTRPVPSTLPAKALWYIGILLRVLLGFTTLLALWAKWSITESQSIEYLRAVLGSTEKEAQLIKFIATCSWIYLAPCAAAVLFLVFRRGYTEESLTLLRGLGVQTSTTSTTYLQTPTTRFIPTTSIQDIFIHEAFKGFEVGFYLMIVVEGEGEVVVVFPTLLPKRGMLEVVWRGARGCLWEPTAEKERDNEGGKGMVDLSI